MRSILTLCVLVIAPALASVLSAAEQPLLIEGKQSLYQRVLAAPGAALQPAPGARTAGTAVTPFTAYYVYQRRQVGGGEWLEVGTDRFGDIAGWLPNSRTIDWNQGLSVAFREPIGHDRALLFSSRDAVKALVKSRDLERYDQLYKMAEQGRSEPGSPVVAIQPATHIDIRENFYLVPIRQHEDLYLGSAQARLLQVSSVPLRDEPAPPPVAKAPEPEPEPKPQPARRGYTAGLTFVIDSTLSMDPYIERTREAVTKIYDSLADAGLIGNVNFGLVAFRDNPEAAPGLEYLARTYVDLQQGRDPERFLTRVNGLRAATVSSRDFTEDAYAGVRQAIEDIDWQGHDARYLVLITDAGAREAGDPLASTGMSADALRQLAQDKGIAVFVLHLLTPSTRANHAVAAEQYQLLSRFPGVGNLYYGVPTGDVQNFGRALDTLAGQITFQVRAAAANAPLEQRQEPVADPQLAQLQEKVAKLGYALRMRYLQKQQGDRIPEVFDAWLLDRDFRNPERAVLDVRVLLTRDQLSDLHDILREVLLTAEAGLLSPQSFLDELQSLAATLARDPERLGATTATTAGEGNSLAQLGFMREYIEDLPYTGEVMNLSLEDWQSWPAREQVAFLHRLEEKINYYKALHDHTDLWVSLDGGPVDGDAVYPVALDMLP